jgi:hypothetical protein
MWVMAFVGVAPCQAGWKPHDVTGFHIFNRSAFPLHPTHAGDDDQHLPQWMRGPSRARARLEGNGRSADAGGFSGCVQRVDPRYA